MEIYVKTKGNAKLRSWIEENYAADEMGGNFTVVVMETLKDLNKFMTDAAHAVKMRGAEPVLMPVDEDSFELHF